MVTLVKTRGYSQMDIPKYQFHFPLFFSVWYYEKTFIMAGFMDTQEDRLACATDTITRTKEMPHEI